MDEALFEHREKEMNLEAYENRLKDISKVKKAIVKHTGGKRGIDGVIDCPICKEGKLHFFVSKRGRIHSVCTTSGCMK